MKPNVGLSSPKSPRRRKIENGVSKAVPIVKRMKRTPSEIQLLQDETVADYRDYCMYSRILNGMSQRNHHPSQKCASSLKVMRNIMRTRNQPVQEKAHSYDEELLKYTMKPPFDQDLETKPSGPDYALHGILYEENDPIDGVTITEPESGETSLYEEGVFMLDL